jgi:hypothetical protein
MHHCAYLLYFLSGEAIGWTFQKKSLLGISGGVGTN